MEKLNNLISDQERESKLADSAARGKCMRVVNITRNTEVATHAEVAASGIKRSKGLLGRKSLSRGGGMWILPCEAVHTFFMQFPLDLIYLDRNHCVKKVRSSVSPWRVSACFSAHSVLELPSGTIRESQTQVGDSIEIVPGDISSNRQVGCK
jgi:uncharacterized membrane protein (UPF0127 family)